MITVVLVFFVFLFLFSWKKRGWDVSTYVCILYVLTSFCAYYLLYNTSTNDSSIVSVGGSLTYMLLITLSIIPILQLNMPSVKTIIIKNTKIIDFWVFFYAVCFFFTIFAYRNDIIFRIAFGDWSALRNSIQDGVIESVPRLSGVLRPIGVLIGVFGSSSFLILPFFFLSICFLKRRWYYNVAALLGSLTSLLYGVLGVDRSAFFYWIIILGLSFFFFRKHLPVSFARRYFVLGGAVISLIVLFFVSVTASRFEKSSDGPFASVIEYAGQPYVNFCEFFSKYDNHEGVNTRVLLPATHKWVIGDYSTFTGLQDSMSRKSGMDCGVFYTFLGAFILDSNQIGPFLFVSFYLFLWRVILRRKRNETITITRMMVAFALCAIPSCGCIAYLYSSPYSTFSLVVILLSLHLSNNGKVIISKTKNI